MFSLCVRNFFKKIDQFLIKILHNASRIWQRHQFLQNRRKIAEKPTKCRRVFGNVTNFFKIAGKSQKNQQNVDASTLTFEKLKHNTWCNTLQSICFLLFLFKNWSIFCKFNLISSPSSFS